jgi:hypothetical protein
MQPLLIILIALGVISLVTLFWLGVNAARKHTAWGMLVLLFSPLSALVYGIRHWRDARVPFIAYSLSLVCAVTLTTYLLHTSGTWQVMLASLHMHQAVQSQDLSGRDALVFTPVSLTTFTRVSPYQREQRRLQLMQDFVEQYEAAFTEADREEINQTISRLMYGSAVTGEQKQQLLALQERVARGPEPEVTDTEPAAETHSGRDLLVRESSRRTAEPHYRLEFLPITAREARDYVGKMFMVTRKDGEEKKYKLIGTSPGGLRFERRIPGGTYSFEYKHQDIEQLRILAQVASY